MTRLVIIAIVLLVAVVVYLIVRAVIKNSRKRPRPLAPDDDPDFLRGLNDPPSEGPPRG
jgi:flagellar biosynthesis/type III secretory pathway M-ring protein FliF/YscJ